MSKEEAKTLRRENVGIVRKISNANTLSVRVETKFPHPKYGKIVKTHKNYLVNFIGDEVEVGDTVLISEAKPFSKAKTWELINIIKKNQNII